METWHGTPLKKLAFDLDDLFSTNQRLKQVFYEQGKEWDYLTSANPFSTETFSGALEWKKRKILEYGYPRNDILYAENKDEIAVQVKKELGIPEGKRVILYAPTWRDNQMYRRGRVQIYPGHGSGPDAEGIWSRQRDPSADPLLHCRYAGFFPV